MCLCVLAHRVFLFFLLHHRRHHHHHHYLQPVLL